MNEADNQDPAERARQQRFVQLFDDHSTELTGFAVRRVGASNAGDVVGETFLIAWQRLADIPPGHARAWLYAAALNVIRHQVRADSRRNRLADRVSFESPPAVTYSSGDPAADRLANQLVTRAVLARMSAPDQEMLRLAEWEQLSHQEIGRVLSCTATAVKVRLHRARRRFAAALTAETNTQPTDSAHPAPATTGKARP